MFNCTFVHAGTFSLKPLLVFAHKGPQTALREAREEAMYVDTQASEKGWDHQVQEHFSYSAVSEWLCRLLLHPLVGPLWAHSFPLIRLSLSLLYEKLYESFISLLYENHLETSLAESTISHLLCHFSHGAISFYECLCLFKSLLIEMEVHCTEMLFRLGGL